MVGRAGRSARQEPRPPKGHFTDPIVLCLVKNHQHFRRHSNTANSIYAESQKPLSRLETQLFEVQAKWYSRKRPGRNARATCCVPLMALTLLSPQMSPEHSCSAGSLQKAPGIFIVTRGCVAGLKPSLRLWAPHVRSALQPHWRSEVAGRSNSSIAHCNGSAVNHRDVLCPALFHAANRIETCGGMAGWCKPSFDVNFGFRKHAKMPAKIFLHCWISCCMRVRIC